MRYLESPRDQHPIYPAVADDGRCLAISFTSNLIKCTEHSDTHIRKVLAIGKLNLGGRFHPLAICLRISGSNFVVREALELTELDLAQILDDDNRASEAGSYNPGAFKRSEVRTGIDCGNGFILKVFGNFSHLGTACFGEPGIERAVAKALRLFGWFAMSDQPETCGGRDHAHKKVSSAALSQSCRFAPRVSPVIPAIRRRQ